MKNKIKKIITIDNIEIDLSHFNLDEETSECFYFSDKNEYCCGGILIRKCNIKDIIYE